MYTVERLVRMVLFNMHIVEYGEPFSGEQRIVFVVVVVVVFLIVILFVTPCQPYDIYIIHTHTQI